MERFFMSENIIYPYNDEYMVMDKLTNHYVLTEAALLSRGIDLRARLSETSTVSPENVINNVLQTASDMIYQYIHAHNGNNAAYFFRGENVYKKPTNKVFSIIKYRKQFCQD